MKKILIVDNSSAIRMLIRIEIEKGDYETLDASSGEEALEMIPKFLPDLITLNVEMSGIDGYKTCSVLRSNENEQLRNIPIVFITSHDTLEKRKKGFSAGATDFITKPFKEGELLSSITKILFPEILFSNTYALVVDNSESVQMVITDCIKGIVETVITASTVKEALAIITKNKNKIDILFTDYHLPDANGDILCSKIRNDLDMKRLPIIFISEILDETSFLKVFKLGASDYIIKPFSKEELIARAKVHLEASIFNKELNKKIEELNEIMGQLTDANKQLTVTKNFLWSEMQIAQKIQTVLLPKKPAIKNFEISAYMEATDEVGGDYYDVINVVGRDWLIIGDVSGHGVVAGLIMMMAQTSIHTVLSENPKINPSELIRIINKTIYENMQKLGEDKYMTIMALACFENDEIIFSGLHQDILVYRAESDTVQFIETNGMWIGIIDNIEGLLIDEKFFLHTNDILLLYTDGIPEAMDKSLEMFSHDRLASVFKKAAKLPLEKIKTKLLEALQGYNKDDDITFVIAKRI